MALTSVRRPGILNAKLVTCPGTRCLHLPGVGDAPRGPRCGPRANLGLPLALLAPESGRQQPPGADHLLPRPRSSRSPQASPPPGRSPAHLTLRGSWAFPSENTRDHVCPLFGIRSFFTLGHTFKLLNAGFRKGPSHSSHPPQPLAGGPPQRCHHSVSRPRLATASSPALTVSGRDTEPAPGPGRSGPVAPATRLHVHCDGSSASVLSAVLSSGQRAAPSLLPSPRRMRPEACDPWWARQGRVRGRTQGRTDDSAGLPTLRKKLSLHT